LEIIVLLQVAVSAISLLLLLLPLRAHMQRMCSLYEMYSCEELSWYKAGQWLRQASSFAVIDGLFVLDGQIDLLLLSFFVGEARVGYYGLAQAVVAILMLLLYSVDTVVYPLLSRSVTRSERLGRNYWQLMGGISAGVIPLALLLVFGAGLIVPHYFSQFKPILSPFYWLTVSWAIHFINVPSARLIIGLGRQNCVATFVAIGVTITTLLSLLTIPLCGIQGPGIARAISAAVYALLCIIAVLALLSSRRCGRDSTVDNTTKGLLPSNPD
jgi:O-antigen/teichoic acid export membrane protein